MVPRHSFFIREWRGVNLYVFPPPPVRTHHPRRFRKNYKTAGWLPRPKYTTLKHGTGTLCLIYPTSFFSALENCKYAPDPSFDFTSATVIVDPSGHESSFAGRIGNPG